MDETDRRLVALLRDNARTPTVALAKALRVSRGTVQNRLDRLLASGTLLGFTIRLAAADDSSRVRAVTSIEIKGGRSGAVLEALRGIAAVRAVHSTNGRWDMVAELDTPDPRRLQRRARFDPGGRRHRRDGDEPAAHHRALLRCHTPASTNKKPGSKAGF